MLITFLKNLPDKRRGQGRMYDVGHLLLFSVLAILSGATSYRQVHTFMETRLKILKKCFGLKWGKAPSYSTIRRVIHGVKGKDLEKAFRAYSKALAETADKKNEKKIKCISVDGKAIRGSFDNFEDKAAIQVLSAFLMEKDIILAHEEIEKKKTNEIPVAQKLIGKLGLKNCIFTFDALHCQKKH